MLETFIFPDLGSKHAGARLGPDMLVAQSEASDRLELEHRLRKAIDAHQFEVHYLPRIELATRRIVGAEAQLRWNAIRIAVMVAPSQIRQRAFLDQFHTLLDR